MNTPRYTGGYLKFTAAMMLAMITGCTVHPEGESQLRQDVTNAGGLYTQPFEKRINPPLAPSANIDAIVEYALLNNSDLERRYWEWRSAVEQIPQEGTQKTNVMISFNSLITNGSTSAAMNTLGIGNDAMNNIVLPSKLELSAKVALENARAAAFRFDQAKADFRASVISAYADFALAAEDLRLEHANLDLLTLMINITESHLGTGSSMSQDILKAINERDLSQNEIKSLETKINSQRTTLNGLLNCEADAPLDTPTTLPTLHLAAATTRSNSSKENGEVLAQNHEIAGKSDAIARAKVEYFPDFGINVSSDLAGVTQSIAASVMLPFLRYQAIDAGIRQAEANLHAAEAMRRQTIHNLDSRIAIDRLMTADLERQVALYRSTILPRIQQIVSLTQSNYATGKATFLDLVDAQRSQIALRRLTAELQMSAFKQQTDLAAVTKT